MPAMSALRSVAFAVLLLLYFTLSRCGAQPAIEVCSTPCTELFGYDDKTSTIEVADSIELADVTISIFIDSPAGGAPESITVTAPDNTIVTFYAFTPHAGPIDCTFSDVGLPYPGRQNYLYPGDPTLLFGGGRPFKPKGPSAMASLAGSSSEGTWTLSLDTSSSTGGVLREWCVRLYEIESVTNLTCAPGSELDSVDIEWVNGDDYDSIEIESDGNLLASLGEAELGADSLDAGAANSYSIAGWSTPQVTELRVFGVGAGKHAAPACCRADLPGLATLSLEKTMSATLTYEEPYHFAAFEFTDAITIEDLIVDIDFESVGPLLVAIASWSGTTVTLQASSLSPYPHLLDVNYWSLGSRNGYAQFDAGSFVRPSGPGSLRDFAGESTVDPSDGNGGWVVAFFSGKMSANKAALRVFDKTPTFATEDFTCEPTTKFGTFRLSWTNQSAYEAIDLYMDGTLIETLDGPFGEGEASSFEVAALELPRTLRFGWQGFANGLPSEFVHCTLWGEVAAVSSFTCDSYDRDGIVTLNWAAPDGVTHSAYDLYAGDEFIVRLDGSERQYQFRTSEYDFDVPGQVDFGIEAVQGVPEVLSRRSLCRALLLSSAELEFCGSAISASEYDQEIISLPSSEIGVVEEVEIVLASAAYSLYQLDLRAPSGTTVRVYESNYDHQRNVWPKRFADGGVPLSEWPGDEQWRPIAPRSSFAALAGEDVEGEWQALFLAPNVGRELEVCVRFSICPLRPPLDLVATQIDEEIELAWSVAAEYDRIEVYEHDHQLAVLEGTSTSFRHDPDGQNLRVYSVCGVNDDLNCRASTGLVHVMQGHEEVCVSDVIIDEYAVSYSTDGMVTLDFQLHSVVGEVDLLIDVPTPESSQWSYSLRSPSGTSIRFPLNPYYVDPSPVSIVWSSKGTGAGSNLDCDFCRVLSGSPGGLADLKGEPADGEWTLVVDAREEGWLRNACLGIRPQCAFRSPSNLTCLPNEDDFEIQLNWTNEDDYESIRVMRGNDTIAELSGSSESYLDEQLIADSYSYQVVGIVSGSTCEAESPVCRASIGILQYCDESWNPNVADRDSFYVNLDVPVDDVHLSLRGAIAASGNYSIELESPSGTDVWLSGGDVSVFQPMDVVFADDGDFQGIEDFDCACFVLPRQPLSGLLDETPKGTWTLELDGPANTYVTEWCLEFLPACHEARPAITSCAMQSNLTRSIAVTWESDFAFDGYRVERDGVCIGLVSGSESEYVDAHPGAPGYRKYMVHGEIHATHCLRPSAPCEVPYLSIEACSTPNDTITSVGGFDRIEWSHAADDQNLGALRIREVAVPLDVSASGLRYTKITLQSPEGTGIGLLPFAPTPSNGDRGFLATFSDRGEIVRTVSTMCGCLVLPGGPGSFDDVVGEDPRGDWSLLYESELDDVIVNEWCVQVFLDKPEPTVEKEHDPRFLRGDVNGDGTVTAITDAIRLLAWQYANANSPPCIGACDADGNGYLLVLQDAIFLLRWQFQDGPPPPAPGPKECGVDPEDPTLESSGGCETPPEKCSG